MAVSGPVGEGLVAMDVDDRLRRLEDRVELSDLVATDGRAVED